MVLLLPAAVGPAQSARPAAESTSSFQISGKVVSSLDAHPLARALVTLADQGTRITIATVTSKPDGTFAFPPVKTGRYTLAGSCRGFLPAAFDQHEQFSTAIVTGADLVTDNLVLRLAPESSVGGRLLDEAGEPVRDGRMTLYRETHNTGTSRIVRSGNAGTDDLGEYELSGLAPGTYYLSAQAQPWYAVHPHSMPNNSPRPTGSIDPALDVVYPVTFYPGATDSAAALPIVIRGAEHIHLDMHLVPQPAVTLRVHTPGAGDSAGFPQLQRKIFDSLEPVQADVRSNGGEFEIAGLPQGALQFSSIRGDRGRSSSVRTVILGRGVNEIEAAEAIPGTAKLSVTVKAEDGSELPRQVRVVLRQGDVETAAARRGRDEDEFHLDALVPGSYTLNVLGNGRTYSVTRVLADGKDLPTTAVKVGPASNQSITLLVSSSQTSLHGLVRLGDKPASGAMVVLVPTDPDAARSLFHRDQSDLDGSFNLSGVPPGRYILIAIDNGWSLDWAKLETLSRYLIHGVPVAVTGNEGSTLNLSTAVQLQPR